MYLLSKGVAKIQWLVGEYFAFTHTHSRKAHKRVEDCTYLILLFLVECGHPQLFWYCVLFYLHVNIRVNIKLTLGANAKKLIKKSYLNQLNHLKRRRLLHKYHVTYQRRKICICNTQYKKIIWAIRTILRLQFKYCYYPFNLQTTVIIICCLVCRNLLQLYA